MTTVTAIWILSLTWGHSTKTTVPHAILMGFGSGKDCYAAAKTVIPSPEIMPTLAVSCKPIKSK